MGGRSRPRHAGRRRRGRHRQPGGRRGRCSGRPADGRKSAHVLGGGNHGHRHRRDRLGGRARGEIRGGQPQPRVPLFAVAQRRGQARHGRGDRCRHRRGKRIGGRRRHVSLIRSDGPDGFGARGHRRAARRERIRDLRRIRRHLRHVQQLRCGGGRHGARRLDPDDLPRGRLRNRFRDERVLAARRRRRRALRREQRPDQVRRRRQGRLRRGPGQWLDPGRIALLIGGRPGRVCRAAPQRRQAHGRNRDCADSLDHLPHAGERSVRIGQRHRVRFRQRPRRDPDGGGERGRRRLAAGVLPGADLLVRLEHHSRCRRRPPRHRAGDR